MLKTGGGTIVDTASVADYIASRSTALSTYVSSKHAVVVLTKARPRNTPVKTFVLKRFVRPQLTAS
jgi:NAD(P)-dependent dehydrogenase (short-subunit alcohol dehydrogenase family)